MPKPLIAAALAVMVAALFAAIACGAADTGDRQPTHTPSYTPGAQPTPDLAATIQAVLAAGAPVGSGRTAAQPTRVPAAPVWPTHRSADAPTLSDIIPAQSEDLDQHIAILSEIVQILADCAAEAGETVPAPGWSGEAGWYARAAIAHSVCAASKGTGVDFTGGN